MEGKHKQSRNPHGSPRAGTSRSGRACKGRFWAEIPVSQLLYLGGCEKIGASSGNGKIRQCEKQTLPSWWHWVRLKGQLLSPPSQGWHKHFLHPILVLPTAPSPRFQCYGDKQGFAVSCLSRRQSWRWNYSTALLPLGWGSLRALTQQNLGLQHERLKNLWVLCPGNRIFCLINSLKNQMQKRPV